MKINPLTSDVRRLKALLAEAKRITLKERDETEDALAAKDEEIARLNDEIKSLVRTLDAWKAETAKPSQGCGAT